MTARKVLVPTVAACPDCGWSKTYASEGIAAGNLRRHRCHTHQMRRGYAERAAARRTASGPTRDCTCPQARHQHGTRAAYVSDRCRCRPCRDAHRTYENQRVKNRAYGQVAFVDAQPVREHVAALRAAGVGWKTVAKRAGIAISTMAHILHGNSVVGPDRQIRPETAAAILAVTADELADGALVPAHATWERIHSLIALGYTRAWISAQLGNTNRALQLDRWQVTAAHERAVAELVDTYAHVPAPPSVGQRRSLAEAARFGWLPPLVGGDFVDEYADVEVSADDVDDIAVERATAGDQVSLTRSERVEAVRRLLARGLTPAQAADRLRMGHTTAHRIAQDLEAEAS
jgi:transcriptional regulator with XRE-family HTH domain